MPAKETDPNLKGAAWKAVRRHWLQKAPRPPCARCGAEIDYTGPRGPWSLDIGHIVGRDIARRLGWTEEEINHLSNTQPEHARCNRRDGVRYGNRKRGRIKAPLITTHQW
jgi:DNA/RNA endonuclease G (NUC1)